MKLLQPLTLALLSTSVAGSLFKTNVIDAWDINDLKQYLKDNSISFDEKKATINELKDLSAKQYKLRNQPTVDQSGWYHPSNLKQKVLNLYNGATDTAYSTTESLSDSSYVDYDNIKNWVFSTWSTKELEKLLKKSGVKYEPTSKRSELIATAQKNYDDIAKHFKASGKYPGDWLYSSWDKKDLKKWLDDYGVDYKSLRDSKEDLVKKVRENSYKASVYAQEEKDDVLDSLDLTSKSLYDKAGSLKDDVFEAWTASQLYKWLKSHKADIDEKAKLNKEELNSVALKYRDDLKSDIDAWSSKAAKTTSPYLEKGSKHVDNLVNDTFFVGIESWSRDRLKAFLEARGVSIPLFATKSELRKLVKANKYKPITNFNSDWFFEGWNKDNIQKWVQEQSDAASQSSKDVWGKANELYHAFVANLAHYTHKASSAASDAYDSAAENVNTAADSISKKVGGDVKSNKDAFFDYWSDVELKKYLASFGIYNTKATKREDLINLAKKNTLWFVGGAQNEAKKQWDYSKLVALDHHNVFWAKLKNWYNHLIFAITGRV
ncbi:CYFA0S29e00650g1_1 [Cyberlindnera fabianii]|uniref:CYFA0S29e00650g1_1 n=1 Tax=Cyberlindnera fabianii TaxID=36022 RepID=A0A061BJG5_CYBFA|nr:Meiotic sister chromatid recombination protein 1 [Cyberlindnera fabianii]CDR47139.1 CYFA0S29e00650g1_1 [Cyberlindnera fabianii]